MREGYEVTAWGLRLTGGLRRRHLREVDLRCDIDDLKQHVHAAKIGGVAGVKRKVVGDRGRGDHEIDET